MGQRRTDRASCQGQRSARDTRRHGTSTGQPLGPSRRMASARTGAVIPCTLLTLATMLHEGRFEIDPPDYQLKMRAAPTPAPNNHFKLRLVERRV